MSKNPIITEGAQGRAFNKVAKLGFPLVAGGESFWVPKDERQLESLSVKANGTYRPKEKYGISRVSVSVPGTTSKLSGKGSDGNDYTVDVDSSDNLVKTKVPSSIQITTEPTDTSYVNGDTIDFTGLVVKAYDGEGNLFDATGYTGGVVPNSELQFPVTQAVYDGEGGTPSIYDEEIDDYVYLPIPVSTQCTQQWTISSGVQISIWSAPAAIFITTTDKRALYIVACQSKQDHYQRQEFQIIDGESRQIRDEDRSIYSTFEKQFTKDGKTVYYGYGGVTSSLTDDGYTIPVVLGKLNNMSYASSPQIVGLIAWTMIYGEQSGGTSSQTIPVNWPRYNDGKILSDSFDITVSPSPESDESNTGGNGGTTVDDDGFSGHDGNF
jgi:hypothetical protein